PQTLQMMRRRRNLEVIFCLISLFLGILCQARAETVILHLKNGDRLAGTILREDTNQVGIPTTWIKELPVPLEQIVSPWKGPPELAGTNVASTLPSVAIAPATNAPAGTNAAQAVGSTNAVPVAGSTNAVPVAGSSNAVPAAVSTNLVAKLVPST